MKKNKATPKNPQKRNRWRKQMRGKSNAKKLHSLRIASKGRRARKRVEEMNIARKIQVRKNVLTKNYTFRKKL